MSAGTIRNRIAVQASECAMGKAGRRRTSGSKEKVRWRSPSGDEKQHRNVALRKIQAWHRETKDDDGCSFPQWVPTYSFKRL
jgi:hypothetical protein